MKTISLVLLAAVLGMSSAYAGEACRGVQDGPELFTDPEPAGEIVADIPADSDVGIANHGSDLVVSRYMASARVYTEWRYFSATSCTYREGCINAPGWRRLLRFYTRIINQGTQNFHIGYPTDAGNADNVQYDSCHGHYHVKDWANYELVTSSGSAVVQGRKQAFCLMDSVRVSGSARRRYSCSYQGITAGWADDYSNSLPCQWIDITGVAPGSYSLRITVNPTRRFVESNYSNNVVTVPVRIR